MTNQKETEPLLLKADEVAAMIAISTRTLWRLISAANFPKPIRVGGSTRWRRADIEKWVENGGCTSSPSDQQ